MTPGAGWEQSPELGEHGKRFVVVEPVEEENSKPPSLHVVENWFAEFRNRQGSAQR